MPRASSPPGAKAVDHASGMQHADRTPGAQATERPPGTRVLLGLALGFLGVLCFSGTLPATRFAVRELDPLFVAFARAVLAGLVAAVVLLVTRSRLPRAGEWRSLFVVIVGLVVGFPALTALALDRVPASHGAVVIGLLPIATAAASVLTGRERPSALFWGASFAGALVVIAFAAVQGGGALQFADTLLLLAVVVAGWGYAEGARVAGTLGTWQVISWAVVLSLPVLAVPMVLLAPGRLADVSPASWWALVYVGVVSQYLGFFPWWAGLRLGGVSRVAQMQLAQPFIAIALAAVFLGEPIGPDLVGFGLAAVVCVAIAARARVSHAAPAHRRG
jgi:drug/metabolite transporter (DMT)-like permease